MTGRDRRRRGLACSVVVLATAIAAAGCIDRGYPLGAGGNVEARPDTKGELFAADLLDAEGKGLEPRQRPYQTGVTLTLSEDNEAANGAFVDVRVEPPEALTLVPDEGEDSSERTCKSKDGAFRCTASPQGIARFIAISEADWSGEATLVVTWANKRAEHIIEILPAGLPRTGTELVIVASGLAESDRVLPTFSALSCSTIDSLPSDLGSKWRPGKVRSREAFVRASAPAASPGIVANAPVVIEALSSEAALSLDPACASKDRKSRLRTILNETGESPPFYLCFSDIGGESVEFSVRSGELDINPNPSVRVAPEPRVLRVAALASTLVEGIPAEQFEVVAFNTDLEPIAMSVDLESSNSEVLKLTQASAMLSEDGATPTVLTVTPLAVGTATIHVRPRLFKQPDCESTETTVTAAPE